MRRIAVLLGVLAIASWPALSVPAFAAIKVPVIEGKGMVCNA